MTVNAIASQIVSWLRTIAAILILAAVGLAVAKLLFPASIPFRIDHIALAYIAGAYWLSK